MIIRKLFSFENAHIVRLCSSKRCKTSIHGHSYRCEVLLESNFLDNAGMVYDFGLMKCAIAMIIDSFDHAITIFSADSDEFKNDIKKHSKRWVEIPLNPSAEQFSRIFFVLIDKILSLSLMQNGEKSVVLNSIIIHETQTGYAKCFKNDAYNENMGKIDIKNIIFSQEIMQDWDDKNFFEKLINGEKLSFNKEC